NHDASIASVRGEKWGGPRPPRRGLVYTPQQKNDYCIKPNTTKKNHLFFSGFLNKKPTKFKNKKIKNKKKKNKKNPPTH
ncbi:hypothetical protein ACVGXS_01595, partial [Enterobacter hormaechei]